jgi:hypothetical protein
MEGLRAKQRVSRRAATFSACPVIEMRQVAMIFTTTVLSGLALMGLIFFIAPPVLGPVLVAIARLPSPFGEIAWVAVLFPLGVIGPPILWIGIYRIVETVIFSSR